MATMDIKKAKDYSEGKALNALNKAIEEAYIQGYNDGFKDGLNQNMPDIEYVDLGLPTGTKWSNAFLTDENDEMVYLTYDEAMKYNIPAFSQYTELVDYCKWESGAVCGPYMTELIIKGRNGNEVILKKNKWIDDNPSANSVPRFWIKENFKGDNNGLNRPCSNYQSTHKAVERFMGEKLAVLLVTI